MELQKLQASSRAASGKGVARKARAAGHIPAVVYGGEAEPSLLTLDPRELRLLKGKTLGWNSPLEIAVDGGDDVGMALLKAVQRHPVSGKLLHADFIRISEGEPVKVRVPVKTKGRAAGATLGGRVSVSLPEVDVVCLPKDIPARIELDISPLDIGDKVLLQAMDLPEGVRVASRHNPPVVACVGKRGARKAAEADEGEAAEAAEA